ncbi:RNA polymerase sigma factor [Cohnella sp. 56]|uniref:RNA polymerase sigma factor n=1 Tax=Cohnella sp. 56 TaxID=3113722 RepID=UPI0030EA0EFF
MQSAFIRKVTLTDKLGAGAAPSAEQVVFDRLDNRDVWTAVMKLPRKYREVLVLEYHYGLKQKEVAAFMKVSEGTVKSRLHRAKKRMNDLLSCEEA